MQTEQAAHAHHRPVENPVIGFILVEFVIIDLDCECDAKDYADYHVEYHNQN
jgi:hypothetical protein